MMSADPDSIRKPTRTAAWRAVAIIGPPAFVVLTGILMYAGLLRSHSAAKLVDHSHEVVNVTERLLAHLTDAETGQRGFVLTGEERYLEPYRSARASVADEVRNLQRLTRDNPLQRARVDSIGAFANRKFNELGTTIDLRRTRGLDAARVVVLQDTGKIIMDSARGVFANLSAEEDRLLAARGRDESRHDNETLIIGIIGLALSVIFALIMSGRLARALTSSEKAERDLADANADLREQATELELANQQLQAQGEELEMQTEELQTQTDELQMQTEELKLNADELEAARDTANEQRLEAVRATEAKSQFLANMSHELRTPLNAIGGHIQLLDMGLHGPINEAQREALKRVDLAQRHLLGLINDILNLTRIQSGKLDYNITDVDLGEVLSDVESMVGPQIRANNLTYATKLGSEDCMVRADADKLRQIVINILGNALKFTPANGSITASVRPVDGDKGKVHLDIRDSGIGIPFEKLEMIFEPFVQVEAKLNRTREGTGLGLAISRDLARGMGGDLSVRSVEGEGSTFTITLLRGNPS